MIDIHCHILPEFDDGASSPEEAIAMAYMAAESGVTAIVATPHFPGKSSSLQRIEPLLERYDWLCRAVKAHGLPLKIYPGAEILCLPETAALAEEKALPTIGDTPYLLTEFYFDEPFANMDAQLRVLLDSGYIPVVAHPERYHAIQADPALLRRWREKGCVLQLNKGSILGAFGPDPLDAAMAALEMRLADLVASDAHSATRRTPHMGALHQWMAENMDSDYTSVLLDRNPARLVTGRRILHLP